jgi:hypothetical protein
MPKQKIKKEEDKRKAVGPRVRATKGRGATLQIRMVKSDALY